MQFFKKIRWAALLVPALALSVTAYAQEWAPTKPVRIVVPITGSTNDVLARLLAPKLQEALGQPFVVENKPGAGGNIGAYEVVRSAPDGHTLLVGYNGPLAINVSLFDKMPYDPVKDLAPITLAVKSSQYLVVNPATGIRDVKDFIAKAKANPTKYSYGSVALARIFRDQQVGSLVAEPVVIGISPPMATEDCRCQSVLMGPLSSDGLDDVWWRPHSMVATSSATAACCCSNGSMNDWV